MRYVIDVEPGEEPIQGTLRRGSDAPVAFCGVLDLLRLLEPATAPVGATPASVTGGAAGTATTGEPR